MNSECYRAVRLRFDNINLLYHRGTAISASSIVYQPPDITHVCISPDMEAEDTRLGEYAMTEYLGDISSIVLKPEHRSARVR